MTAASAPTRVVFVENSNRSQMAEAFARNHGEDRVEAHSAGSHPSGRVNPKAVEAMRELGYDLTRHNSKSLADGHFNRNAFEAIPSPTSEVTAATCTKGWSSFNRL